MKKTVLVPFKSLKILYVRWLTLGLTLGVFVSLVSVIYYLLKNLQSLQQPIPLSISYVMDQNWQFTYSQLLTNLIENVGEENWKNAIQLAEGIEPLPMDKDITITRLENQLQQWNQALEYLDNIPRDSSFSNQSQQKQKEYQKNRNFIDYKLENKHSQWLGVIAESSPIYKQNIMITICNFSDVCRRFQGSKEILSPASLIKMPVAVAVMKKVNKDQIKLEHKIKVMSGNFTEDASDIRVGKEYPLNHLLFRMINQSSNIATNQLIDYLGWDAVNENLRKSGYQKTYIGYKVVGERTYPTNAGCCPNRLTTDELTQMMVDIYTINNPENKALVKFLAAQEDQTMGYAAFQGKEMTWLGEKTGRHSKFKGTTLAAKIHDKKYIITVAITRGTADIVVSNLVNKIAKKIHKSGDLEKVRE